MPAEGLHIRIRIRDPRQECGCPPWTRCVHFDGEILWLSDRRRSPHADSNTHYGVALGREVSPCSNLGAFGPPCRDGCKEPVLLIPASEYLGRCLNTESLSEAQAEFARRAELLRLGEPRA